MHMNNLISQINQYESQIGLTDDAVIHKAMQEWLELIEALNNGNTQQIEWEMWDAISNILSAHYRVTEQLPTIIQQERDQTLLSLAINLGQRNDMIQKYRGIYSRNTIESNELHQKTSDNIATIISLSENILQKKLNIIDILQQQIDKFAQRLHSYTPQIDLHKYIKAVPNFPKEGILFRDIAPLLQSPQALQYTTELLSRYAQDADVIIGLDARGFIFWIAVARHLNKPFVMIRKKGKLPWDVIEADYELEYWMNTQAIQLDSIQPWQKVAIIDDLLATWWTAACAAQLIEKSWGIVQWCHFVINLTDLQWIKQLQNYKVNALMDY